MADELIGRMKRPGVGGRLAQAVLDVVAAIPASTEASSLTPRDRAMALAHRASKKAAAISGGAALMPGPAGLLTLLPDIIGVWKVQAQMVADIAAAYGKSATLGKEQMLYCLFRHLFTQGLRDIIVRAGERYLVQRTSLQLFQAIAMKIGVRLSERALGKAMARYLPLVGATGVAAYAYFDTRKVAATAIELFSAEVVSPACHPSKWHLQGPLVAPSAGKPTGAHHATRLPSLRHQKPRARNPTAGRPPMRPLRPAHCAIAPRGAG